MRLQKFMATCGVASRRASETIIASGRVTVNGTLATVGMSIDPDTDTVCLDGKPLGEERLVYLILNKSPNVVTSAKDTHGRKTVLDSIQPPQGRVFPVGRLDIDVTGALLLTNDGELAYRLTHPRFCAEKVYLAKVEGKMLREAARRLETGVELEDGKTAPCRVAIIKEDPRATLVRLVLHEGRKRQVKRMCAEVGHPVRELRRVSFGGVDVKGLEPGAWRHLTPKEVLQLKRLVGLG
jgi:23S rRNA pseudouridine2605 synthase